MKMKSLMKWLAASAVFSVLCFAANRADAVLEMTYNDGTHHSSQYLLGTVVPGQKLAPGQAERDAAMTNLLLGMSSPSQMLSNGALYSRTLLGGPAATTTGAVIMNGFSGGTDPISINLSHYGTFQYLVAAYDGKNGGVAVWNISGLTGTIQIYRYAKPEMANGHPTGNLLGSNTMQQGYFLITSWTLLNPTGVPDGGTTMMLLGTALGVLAVVRRCLLRS